MGSGRGLGGRTGGYSLPVLPLPPGLGVDAGRAHAAAAAPRATHLGGRAAKVGANLAAAAAGHTLPRRMGRNHTAGACSRLSEFAVDADDQPHTGRHQRFTPYWPRCSASSAPPAL